MKNMKTCPICGKTCYSNDFKFWCDNCKISFEAFPIVEYPKIMEK